MVIDPDAPAMGERVCYREFCPDCDAPVSVTDEACPDCGASLPDPAGRPP